MFPKSFLNRISAKHFLKGKKSIFNLIARENPSMWRKFNIFVRNTYQLY